MISIEIIVPSRDERFYAQVDETVFFEDFEQKMRGISGLKNGRILFSNRRKNVTGDMPVGKVGLTNGCQVVIKNE